jgi:hypothetical protein
MICGVEDAESVSELQNRAVDPGERIDVITVRRDRGYKLMIWRWKDERLLRIQ